MSNRFYARSREKQPPEAWQPLKEDLRVVLSYDFHINGAIGMQLDPLLTGLFYDY